MHRSSTGATDASEKEEPAEDVATAALDILAGLASLGISDALREKVSHALGELSRSAAAAGQPDNSTHHILPAMSSTPSSQEQQLQQQVTMLESKAQMSRSIMRKLYHKCTTLEKELASLKAGGTSTASPSPADERPYTAPALTGHAGQSLSAQAIQERDLTITQLQQALDATRRHSALLASIGASSANNTKPGSSTAAGPSISSVKEVLAQSAMHFQKYKQIREDYNRLLQKRAGTLQTNRAASSAAKSVVSDMQARLVKEVQEREAEAALYSARIFETERALQDWYVERQMLEEHISKLSLELRERDRLDGEIEGCVSTMFERLRVAEAESERLRARLRALGEDAADGPSCAAVGSTCDSMPGSERSSRGSKADLVTVARMLEAS